MSTYVSPDPEANEQIASLKEDIRQLKIEIQRVMNQQKRIIKSVGVNAVRLDRIEGGRRY
jgi:TolA-binding protein